MRAGMGLAGALALTIALGIAAQPARAEIRRLEVAGSAPAGANARRGIAPRDAAVESAVREAVERVARSLMGTASPRDGLPEPLAANPLDYAVRYRILEDRGERRAVFARDARVTTEYVVLVDVQVDVDRVRSALRQAGRLARRGGEARRFRIVLDDVERWEVVSRVQEGLRSVGASRASVVEVRPGQVSLAVDAGQSAEGLVDRLVSRAPSLGLSIRPLGREGDALHVRATASRPGARRR